MGKSYVARDWVDHHAYRDGDQLALESVDDGTTVTWSELEYRVSRVAGLLADRFGVRRGDRVAVVAESDTRLFEVQFACIRLGAILVPLNWRLAVAELQAMIHDSAPVVLIHDETLRASATALADQSAVPRLAWKSDAGDAPDYESELQTAAPRGPSRDNRIDAITHILYTSGSTGVPKGVIITAENGIWNFLNSQRDKSISAASKMYNPMPLFHAGGISALANPILFAGGSVAVARRFDPDQAVQVMGNPQRRITHFTGVLTLYQTMIDSPHWAAADLSNMAYMECGGGGIPNTVSEAMGQKGVILQSVYGGTETGPACIQMPREDAVARPGSIGRLAPHTQLRLVGPDGDDVEPGTIGEIWLRGPSISPGYWQTEVEGAHDEDGWFHTGDAARIDDEGFYYAMDRYKNMYKTGGENVYPAEVQALLFDHPSVAEIVIIGVPDPKWGETGHAIVAPVPGHEVTLTDFVDFAAGRLAKYKLPTRLTIVDSMPHNATGKIDLRSIRQSLLSDSKVGESV